MLSLQGVFRCLLKGQSLRTDWREVCSLSGGQDALSQWTQRFDELIKPRAKSVEDYSHVFGLITLFGSRLRFGTNTLLRQRVQNPPATHSVSSEIRRKHVFVSYLHLVIFAEQVQSLDGLSEGFRSLRSHPNI